jgi:hypothetical protein
MATYPQTRCVRIVVCFLLLSMVWLTVAGSLTAHAQDPHPPIAAAEIRLVGLEIQPSPAMLVVPKNTGTIITPLLIRSDGVTGELPALPEDAFFVAELRGPGFKTPVPISAPLNNSFLIPPLALAGNYTLENIRLIHQGEILIESEPSIVGIEVIEKVLETQVTVKLLTADEIQQRGIFIDESNYQVVDFTVAFGLEQGTIGVNFPMILPKRNYGGLPPVCLSGVSGLQIHPKDYDKGIPALKLALNTPNIEISGFGLNLPPEEDEREFDLPPIAGAVIIPGNIGYLNQFFSVMIKVSNAAPGYAALVVKDLKTEIILPVGSDGAPGTSDDPLRMARIGTPPAAQPQILPVVGIGPDKLLDTADDIFDLAPQQNADAEFLVEGVREGVHQLNFKITGTLHGLPSGPIPLEGFAVGMVEVRNPKFSLTVHHPETITAGELYDFMVTVTNISETPANFVSLSLLPRSISGALIKSQSTINIQTIEPGDSATVTFVLESQKTGSVTSNAIATDGIPGKFELYTAVGELGIPMSPNVMVLPKEGKELPADLYTVGTGLLGQAHAVATAPFLPKGLLPISRGVVYEHALELTAAGQRVEMGEALGSVARDLALDFLGNNFARIDTQYSADGYARIREIQRGYTGFDGLLRKSRRGAQLVEILAQLLGQDLAANGLLEFQMNFAENAASRPQHLSVVVGNDGGTAPVLLAVSDSAGKRLGCDLTTAGAGGCSGILREIPFANFFPLLNDSGGSASLALLASPQNGRHVIEILGVDDGIFDLGLVLPVGDGLQRVAFEDVATSSGAKATLVVQVGDTNTFQLSVDDDGDGVVDRTVTGAVQPVVDPGPRLISATLVFIPNPIQHISKHGILIAALFSEEIDLESAQHKADPGSVTHYTVDENDVSSVYVQASGRVVTMWLRDGIGPFVERMLTATNIRDVKQNAMAPGGDSVPIRTQKVTPNDLQRIIPGTGGQVHGVVRRVDGTPIPFAGIAMIKKELDKLDKPYWLTITVKQADADGAYSLDFVNYQDTSWQFHDYESNEQGHIYAKPGYDGQNLALDLILRGRGALIGKVTDKNGDPLAGAHVG